MAKGFIIAIESQADQVTVAVDYRRSGISSRDIKKQDRFPLDNASNGPGRGSEPVNLVHPAV
jgi:hypothetical protein